MNILSKIYVSGHSGLVGSAIIKCLQKRGYTNLITRTHSELNLLRQKDVETFFESERPEYVFHAAAKAGGIGANTQYPADFLYENLQIQQNVIKSAFDYGVKKLLFIASTAVYPQNAKYPINEDSLLSGKPSPGNEGYAIAKIAGIKLCELMSVQYGANFITALPTNLYGVGDKDNLQTAHVIPSLIRKFRNAVGSADKKVTIWGSGNARREFLHADDLADACLFLMNNYSDKNPINVGFGTDISICELANLIAEISCFQGILEFDTSKPEGRECNIIDSSKIRALGWTPKITLKKGLEELWQY